MLYTHIIQYCTYIHNIVYISYNIVHKFLHILHQHTHKRARAHTQGSVGVGAAGRIGIPAAPPALCRCPTRPPPPLPPQHRAHPPRPPPHRAPPARLHWRQPLPDTLGGPEGGRRSWRRGPACSLMSLRVRARDLQRFRGLRVRV
jgi:hypothetical protein